MTPRLNLNQLSAQVNLQSITLTASDAFLIVGAITGILILVLAVLPIRTYPPRLAKEKG